MRKKIVAGNWKMNLDLEEGKELVRSLIQEDLSTEVECILIPSFVHLSEVSKLTEQTTLKLGSQNNHAVNGGAYTGEVSAKMLQSVGVSYGLVGHSERRIYQKEDAETLSAKVQQLLKNGINPIFCCGESLSERKNSQHFETVEKQLQLLWELEPKEFEQVIIAYEPVWAIGTGETATAEQAQEMHTFIRAQLQKNFGTLAAQCSILYGGSCKPGNAAELFAQEDVDGGLIGGASLKAKDFAAIVNAF